MRHLLFILLLTLSVTLFANHEDEKPAGRSYTWKYDPTTLGADPISSNSFSELFITIETKSKKQDPGMNKREITFCKVTVKVVIDDDDEDDIDQNSITLEYKLSEPELHETTITFMEDGDDALILEKKEMTEADKKPVARGFTPKFSIRKSGLNIIGEV